MHLIRRDVCVQLEREKQLNRSSLSVVGKRKGRRERGNPPSPGSLSKFAAVCVNTKIGLRAVCTVGSLLAD